jgi:hypothetical protein
MTGQRTGLRAPLAAGILDPAVKPAAAQAGLCARATSVVYFIG